MDQISSERDDVSDGDPHESMGPVAAEDGAVGEEEGVGEGEGVGKDEVMDGGRVAHDVDGVDEDPADEGTVDGEAAGDGGDPDHIPTDEVFALLSNGRRRHVLRFLRRNDGEIKLRELATAIAAEENGVEPVEVTYTQRKRLYTSLYQSHLPRMERSGVIEYDRNSGLVTLAAAAEDFDAYLEVVGENEFTWSEFYLGLTGLFAALTLAYATGTPPFAAFGPAVVMTAMTLLLLVAAVAHVRYTRGRQL
ncbi:DUF7344 domain-containing protein [Halorubrum aethiopicum]|uniref:DUF7344 domain-containing protein n=1 Tax=Halorubrum aethiopicum TaxID=1758255 RepID=UPI0012FEA724|nr:DUF308 domain-containing protein [Halorubrum aethiopicum]